MNSMRLPRLQWTSLQIFLSLMPAHWTIPVDRHRKHGDRLLTQFREGCELI